MQRALQTVEIWCDEVGLSAILMRPTLPYLLCHIYKEQETAGFIESLFFGVTLRRSVSVKYLGVILDSWLTWRKHVNIEVKVAQN